ncbi:MAG: glycine cleavage system protein GcvH [Pseudomonadota bacterium]|jgi:glycine cleavage system H protein
MSYPNDRRYASSHEWVKLEGDVATIGITQHAQDQLGDVVHVELPAVGKAVAAGEGMAEVESVKAVSDIYAPVAGVVVEVNGALDGNEGMINSDPHGAGWMVRLRVADPGAVAGLLDAAAYAASL